MVEKTLEEITIHEVNRIGHGLEKDIEILHAQFTKDSENKELASYANIYLDKLKQFNEFTKETNSYLQDHIVKYYRDIKDMTLSYTKQKKKTVGFINEYRTRY